MKKDDIEHQLLEERMDRKRDDLLMPLLHNIDEIKIDHIIQTALQDQAFICPAYNRISKTTVFKALPTDRKPDLGSFMQRLQENYRKLPGHLVYDIFKLYYWPIDKLVFKERSAVNRLRYEFLERANDPIGKVMTAYGSLKSAIYTRSIIIYYLLQITQLDFIDPQTAQDLIDGLSNDTASPGPAAEADTELDKLFGSSNSRKALDRAMKEAQDTCKMLDETMGKEAQDLLFDQAYPGGNNRAGKVSPHYINKVAGNLANIRMSMRALKEKLRKVIDRSSCYFSYGRQTIYEDLLTADDITGFEDHLLIHPKLRKFFIQDAQVKQVQYKGRLDVYLDVSSSMSNSCGSQMDDGRPVTRLEFAKAMIAKMKEMDMLSDLYLFDTKLTKYASDLVSISMIGSGGGTKIDEAVKQIVDKGRSAVVITDAEDVCKLFTEKAFFIGLKGVRFNQFDRAALRQYAARGQLVVFDGERVLKVNESGELIP